MARKKVEKVIEGYSKLETYCIWLNEYYESLRQSGFKDDIALSMIQNKDTFPEWVSFSEVTKAEIIKHIEDTEDE